MHDPLGFPPLRQLPTSTLLASEIPPDDLTALFGIQLPSRCQTPKRSQLTLKFKEEEGVLFVCLTRVEDYCKILIKLCKLVPHLGMII